MHHSQMMKKVYLLPDLQVEDNVLSQLFQMLLLNLQQYEMLQQNLQIKLEEG